MVSISAASDTSSIHSHAPSSSGDRVRPPIPMPPESTSPSSDDSLLSPRWSSPENTPRSRRKPDLSSKQQLQDGLSLTSPGRLLGDGALTMSPPSKRAHSASPFRLTMPYISPGQLAFSAMQFLPVPLLVLNNLKTVVLANEAMGRLLGIPLDPAESQDETCTLDQLRGQTLSQVGIDMIQDGRPVWISWDDLFDSLVVDGEVELANEAARRQSLIKLPEEVPTPTTASPRPGGVNGTSNGENGADRAAAVKPYSNSAIEVVVSSKAYRATAPPTKSSERQVLAKMIITVFEVEENQRYFTLTFTNTESPITPPGPRRPVPRSSASALEAVDKRTISYSNPSSASSSHGSNSPSFRISPSCVSLSSSPFPPMGPPSRSATTNTPSLFQKMTTIKDALLDNTQMPILALWKDGSAPVMNAAARDLFNNPNSTHHTDELGMDILNEWEVFDDEFSRAYEPNEFPIAKLLKTGEPFTGMRVGMIHKRDNRKIIFDCLGEIIKDPLTDEMLAGVVTCRDVTDMAQEITTIKEQDEERFKLICDTMPQMLWTTTPDGMHDFFNSRWYDYTGLTPEDSLGLGWKHPFHPDDMPATIRRWKHCLETGDPYMTEYRCRSKEGEWRWMLGRALPLRNKQTGKIEKWFGTCTDVHESLETKAAARRMRQQLLSVLSHVQTTIFSVDRDRNVTMIEGAILWNNRQKIQRSDDDSSDDDLYALRYVGRNVDEVFNDLNPGMRQGEAPSFLTPIHDMLDGKRRRDVVQEHELDEQFVRTRFMPTFGKKSHDGLTSESVVDGVIGIITDVTELKERELDLQAQAKEKRQLMANEAAAKEASRLKSQFLANMSHEIRTPITGVIGMAELLLDMPLGEEQKEYAHNIVRSANALLTVINDILDFSKVESGRLDIEEVQFSLSVVVQDVSKMLSFAAERKNLAFRADISPDIAKHLVVLGDPGRVRQIITNLLTNSIKFTDSGCVRFSVLKESETQDTIEIKFVIEDTGIGIEEDVRKRLFQPFSQGDPSTARKFGGTGLGLTISKNLVELMHGRISLQSTIGNGTTATFWIPFNKSQSPQTSSSLVDVGLLPDRLQSEMSMSCASSDYEHVAHTPPVEMLATSEKLRPPRKAKSVNLPSPLHFGELDLPMSERANVSVLVVEDNAINQQIAIKTIKKLGFKVEAVWNGKEALDFLEASQEGNATKPDIILMDVQMPVIDGYKCTHILRHHVPYKAYISDVPIVAMTASAIQGDREKCTKAGMDDYLAKPVKGKLLERMLVKWSKSRRRSPTSTNTTDASISDCSEAGGQCISADIPIFGLPDFDGDTATPDEQSPTKDLDAEYQMDEGDRREDNGFNLLTPKPLLSRDGSREIDAFSFESFTSPPPSQTTRQLDSNELAMHLRDDKLLDAAGGTDGSNLHTFTNPLSEGDSLTEENVGRLEMEGARNGRQ